MFLSVPHGGRLITALSPASARPEMARAYATRPAIRLSPREISDLGLIAIGAVSPLDGFMDEKTYHSVVDRMRLPDGLVFPLPIVLPVREEEARGLRIGEVVRLLDKSDRLLGLMTVSDIFRRDLEWEAQEVYRTNDPAHPGVAALGRLPGPFAIGGKVTVFDDWSEGPFAPLALTPTESRARFESLGWQTVVGFQTRNPIHRAHEYIQKCSLEIVDGLFLHPLVGETKEDDVPASVRMDCYNVLLERYYPRTRVVLGVFPGAMRYAGPREALFHALVRKNYGCTHFIVGRDHAGVGSYYGPFEAHALLRQFSFDELGIIPIFFDTAYYCRTCEGMVSHKTCGHDESSHVLLSGTKVRQMLRDGLPPPPEMTRPEVAAVLIGHYRKREESIPAVSPS